jgi:catechol 2,3-dioxygenase-like lactoylglutathione lyase family enzyme
MQIERIDHLVLTVQNIQASCDFYTKVLGMKAVAFQGGRQAVVFGNQKINFHESGKEFDPKALRPTTGSADLCFIAHDPITKIMDHLDRCDLKIIEGPVERTGAMGPMTSVYIRDPDQNLIEIAVYNQDARKKKG